MQTSNLAIKIPTLINMPLLKGYVDGKIRYFPATDASDNKIAVSITKSTEFRTYSDYDTKFFYSPRSERLCLLW